MTLAAETRGFTAGCGSLCFFAGVGGRTTGRLFIWRRGGGGCGGLLSGAAATEGGRGAGARIIEDERVGLMAGGRCGWRGGCMCCTAGLCVFVDCIGGNRGGGGGCGGSGGARRGGGGGRGRGRGGGARGAAAAPAVDAPRCGAACCCVLCLLYPCMFVRLWRKDDQSVSQSVSLLHTNSLQPTLIQNRAHT
jgi:hypothetical protein